MAAANNKTHTVKGKKNGYGECVWCVLVDLGLQYSGRHARLHLAGGRERSDVRQTETAKSVSSCPTFRTTWGGRISRISSVRKVLDRSSSTSVSYYISAKGSVFVSLCWLVCRIAEVRFFNKRSFRMFIMNGFCWNFREWWDVTDCHLQILRIQEFVNGFCDSYFSDTVPVHEPPKNPDQ